MGRQYAIRPIRLSARSSASCVQNELGALKVWEEKLRGEMLAPGGVEEIYTLTPAVPSKRLKGMVIRVRRGKAENLADLFYRICKSGESRPR